MLKVIRKASCRAIVNRLHASREGVNTAGGCALSHANICCGSVTQFNKYQSPIRHFVVSPQGHITLHEHVYSKHTSFRLVSEIRGNGNKTKGCEQTKGGDKFIDLELLAKDIIKHAESNYTYPLHVSASDIAVKIESLLNLQCDLSDIKTLLTINQTVLTATNNAFTKALVFLDKHGFRQQNIVSMLHHCDELLAGQTKLIIQCLDSLRQITLKEKEAIQLIASDPNVRHITHKDMTSRVAQLKGLFKTSHVLRLILKSPKLLYDDFSEVAYKFQYVIFKLGVDQKPIMSTKLFDHSVMHIKTRHEFLERAGLYQLPNKKGETTIENPSLYQIFDTSDSVFAQKVAKMPTADYMTFKKLYELEEEMREEQSDSDQSESDDE
ncbi:unnamed protein product [Owenia fusiformis]|uniref:Uncharacterized protein n=1 Tax=Owenia fusiformis TaxID=6347 RepID=A0A8S4PXS0_OWEFU|nr:unnamed protein product [Owenia fusiformis]